MHNVPAWRPVVRSDRVRTVVKLEGRADRAQRVGRWMNDADALAAAKRDEGLDEAEWVCKATIHTKVEIDEKYEVRQLAASNARISDRTLGKEVEQPRQEEEDFPWDDGEDECEHEVQEPHEAIVTWLPRFRHARSRVARVSAKRQDAYSERARHYAGAR